MTRCISQGNLRGGAILYSLYIMIKNEIGEREIRVKKGKLWSRALFISSQTLLFLSLENKPSGFDTVNDRNCSRDELALGFGSLNFNRKAVG